MNKQIKTATMLCVAGGMAVVAQAEFGVGLGATRYRGDFRSAAAIQARPNNPGTAAAGTDHFYDDGYNRVDSSDNFDHLTSYWGYQNASQYDPLGDGGNGTITMNSSQAILDAGSSSDWPDVTIPGLELYWQQDLAVCASWVFGLRGALRWQHITFDHSAVYSTTITTISDTYSLGGILPPGDPFAGSWAGPNALLNDQLVRTYGAMAGSAMTVRRTLDADLFAFDLGPTMAFNISARMRAVLSAGVTVAWLHSDFSYQDEAWGSGSVTDRKWLTGGYASGDLQYRLGEHWGLFGGVVYTRLEDFSQQSNGRMATLRFDNALTIRTGLYFH